MSKDNLQLPKTNFSMKASLPTNKPKIFISRGLAVILILRNIYLELPTTS